jgi:hypothetical protein
LDSAYDKINKNLFWTDIIIRTSKANLIFFSSYFDQFNLPYANGFKIAKKKKANLLNSEELASVFHFPIYSQKFSALLKVNYLKYSPMYILDNPSQPAFSTIDGSRFYLDVNDRRCHQLILGKTGMGKSNLLKSMILNNSLCVFDPHGDLINEVLQHYPKNRANDLVYLDVSNYNFPFCFNPLDVKSYEQRILIVSSIVDVFKKMFGHSWGPRLEYFLKNSLLLITEVEGCTLLSLNRLFIDEDFLKELLFKANNNFLNFFFYNEFLNQSAKVKNEIISPIMNKIGVLLMDPVLRNIFASTKNKLDMNYLINSNKVILIDLSKGKIGSLNSGFLGSLMLSMFQNAAMSRAFLNEDDRKDFYLYIDEFQNFATDYFANSLSELRKYRMNLILANQFLDQLSEVLVKGVIGNVANYVLFRLGMNDAEIFLKQLNEKIPIDCFLSISKHNAYAKIGDNLLNVGVCPINYSKNSEHEIIKLVKNSQQKYCNSKKGVEFKLSKWISSIN